MATKTINIHDKPTRKVGFLLRTHGYKGHIKISLDEDDFEPEGFLLVSINDKFVPFKIDNYNDDAGIIKLKGINTIDEANKIVGKQVLDFVTENDTEADSFNGYTLVDEVTKKEYPVTATVEMPNQVLLEFRNGYKDTLLPFHPDLIVSVNHETKTITAHFPEGILDL
jgi:16S rRNA processing protein RimM